MSKALKQDPAALNQFTPKRKLVETMSGASVAFKVTVELRSTRAKSCTTSLLGQGCQLRSQPC